MPENGIGLGVWPLFLALQHLTELLPGVIRRPAHFAHRRGRLPYINFPSECEGAHAYFVVGGSSTRLTKFSEPVLNYVPRVTRHA